MIKYLFSFLILGFPFFICAQDVTKQTVQNAKAGRLINDTSFIYQLPYLLGKKYLVVQGSLGVFSHKHMLALDFKMKEGTPVCAARSGIVIATEGSFAKAGMKEYYLDKGNYIFIKHDDGSIGKYWHFKFEGVMVKEGDRIRAGQQIGLSGNTGYSAFPHLHFQVENAMGRDVMVRFDTQKGVKYLRPGRRYKAVKNYR